MRPWCLWPLLCVARGGWLTCRRSRTARGQRRPVANSAGGSASPVARGRSSAAALRRGDDDVDGAAWSGTPIAADAEVCSATPAAYATRRANRPWVLAVTDVGHRDRGDGEPVGRGTGAAQITPGTPHSGPDARPTARIRASASAGSSRLRPGGRGASSSQLKIEYASSARPITEWRGAQDLAAQLARGGPAAGGPVAAVPPT